MDKERGIRADCQRWILGRRLADNDDSMTLQQYDICPSNSSLFLYVLAEPIRPVEKQLPVQPVQPPPPAEPVNSARKYYNYEEDRYSTCDESDDDGGPAQQPLDASPAEPEPQPVLAELTDGQKLKATGESRTSKFK